MDFLILAPSSKYAFSIIKVRWIICTMHWYKNQFVNNAFESLHAIESINLFMKYMWMLYQDLYRFLLWSDVYFCSIHACVTELHVAQINSFCPIIQSLQVELFPLFQWAVLHKHGDLHPWQLPNPNPVHKDLPKGESHHKGSQYNHHSEHISAEAMTGGGGGGGAPQLSKHNNKKIYKNI